MNRFTLITNIHFATINAMRLEIAALLVQEQPHGMNRKVQRYQLRGFGPDPAWPIFDLDLKSPKFERASARSQHSIIGADDTLRPLSTGEILTFEDGPEVQLVMPHRSEEPLDVEVFEGDNYGALWAVLTTKTARYWKAPNMPTLAWLPTQSVRFSRGG